MTLLDVPIEVPAQVFDRRCEICGRVHECSAEDLLTDCERDVCDSYDETPERR